MFLVSQLKTKLHPKVDFLNISKIFRKYIYCEQGISNNIKTFGNTDFPLFNVAKKTSQTLWEIFLGENYFSTKASTKL